MQIKEIIKKEVDCLDCNSLLNLYEYISILKNVVVHHGENKNISLISVQESLSSSTSDWGESLVTERGERV